MTHKLPWMKFYPADWSQDTTPLSLAGRGAWITIVCAMWRSEDRGKLSLPLAGFCRLLGATEAETLAVLEELSVTGIASRVTEADKKVTLTCRRMVREFNSHRNHALRQQRYRETHQSDALLTGEKSEVRSQKSDKEKIAAKDKPSPPAARIKIADQQWIEELRPDCIKQGIDLDAEIIKAKRWLLKAPGRKFTQKYLINWLNRADKTIEVKTGKRIMNYEPGRNRDRAIREIVLSLEASKAAALTDADYKDAVSAMRDKYRDMPGVLNEALEIIKGRQRSLVKA